MKVAVISGHPVLTKNQAKWLNKLGVEVSVFLPTIDPTVPQIQGIVTHHPKTANSLAHNFKREVFEYVPLVRGVYRRLDSFKLLRNFDLIHVNCAFDAWIPFIVKKIYGTPYVLMEDAIPPLTFYRLSKGAKRKWYFLVKHISLPIVANAADRVLSESSYIKRTLKKIYDIDSTVTYMGVDTNIFNPNVSGKKIRQKLKIEDSKVILFIGRFTALKDPLTFIRAIPIIKKKEKSAKFLMIPDYDGEIREQVIDEATRLGVKDSIIFLPPTTHESMSVYYAAADIFVNTSVVESFGQTLIEAMASGVPVVGSTACAIPEVLGDAGLIFEATHSEDLAEKVITLLNNQRLVNEMRLKGLQRVQKLFTWKKAAKHLLDIYENVSKKNSIHE